MYVITWSAFLKYIIDMRICVRYNSFTNICSEVVFMERVTDAKNNIFTHLMDSYQVVRSRPQFKVYPQMPIRQIQHFVKQAARLNRQVAVQLNPSLFSSDLSEVWGKISVSSSSGHIILSPKDGKTFHLIQAESIRHLRIL